MSSLRAASRGLVAGVVLLAVATTPALAASSQATFGRPIVTQRTVPNDVRVYDGKVVHNLPVVTQAEQELSAATAANASGAQVVTLGFGEHKTYAIPIRVGMFTTFVLPKDDPIQQFAISDPGAVQLNVNAATNTAMLKLTAPVTVAGTIVTSKHTFYLEVSPAGRDAPWYQGVNWSFNTDSFGHSSFGYGVASLTPASAGAPAADGMPADSVQSAGGRAYIGTPNFDYTISGGASFRPVAVWDNGRFTWIQFSKKNQELPALFVDGPNGLEVVNYTVHADGTQILVNRLMPAFVLKLGKQSVRVEAAR